MQGYYQAPNVTKTFFKMPAYSSAYNPAQKDIEAGDKIILHTGVLHALLQRFGERPLPQPLLFEIQNVKDRRISHCGVLEFSAEQSTAFLPQWMMLNMGLSEGQDIQLKLKELPLATALVLQPLKWTFAEIPTPKIALEHALASFTALTAGDTIRIRVNGHPHDLTVVDVSPPTKQVGSRNAACVVNAHLEVDFLPPLESEPESEQAAVLSLEERKEGEVAPKGSYRYYRVKTSDANSAFQAELTARAGDPELVISTSTNKPDMANCSWKSVSSSAAAASASSSSASAAAANDGSKRRLTVLPDSPGFVVGWYYVGVYAYGDAYAVYDLVLREVDPTAAGAAAADGARAGASVGSLTAADPNAKLCPNCHQYISQKAFSLHSAQCARLNVYCEQCAKPIRKSELPSHAHCPVCNVVIRPEDMAKHHDLLHASVSCPQCGDFVDPSALALHKAEECKMRPAACPYCHMQMAHRLVFEHQQSCGAQTIPCDRCSKPVPRRRMDIHLAAEHGVNPSYRPGDRSSLGPAPQMSAADFRAQQQRAAGFISKEKDVPVNSVAAAAAAGRPLTDEEQMALALQASLAAAAADPNARSETLPSPSAPMQRATSLEDAQDMALQAALLESRAAAAAFPVSAAPASASSAMSSGVAAARAAAASGGILSPGFDGVITNDDWNAAVAEQHAQEAAGGGAAADDSMSDAADGMDDAAEDDGAVDTWSDDDGEAGHHTAGNRSSSSSHPASPAKAAAPSAHRRMPELDCPYCSAQHQTEAEFEKHLASCEFVE